MEIPYISGEYRVLFRPEKAGSYVNDHCIIKKENEYHLFGITSSTGKPSDERYFVHAVGRSMTDEFREAGRAIDRGTLAWSPCVTEREGSFYMHYGPSPMSLAVSRDMYEWFGYPVNIKNEPCMAMHRDHFVLKTNDGRYLMYVTGIKDGMGCITLASSDDLINWEFRGYALTSAESAGLNCAWGATESPFVVFRGGLYYLFITYTDSSSLTYNNTLVFVSENPYYFGCYPESAVPVASLYAHAPEIIHENGEDFITTCGWTTRPNPNPGCVSAARLMWKQA